jgi:hypothetical protein
MMTVRISSAFLLTSIDTQFPLDTTMEQIEAMYYSPDAFVVEIIRVDND